MTKQDRGKWSCKILLLLVATAIVASGQTFTTLANFDGSNGTSPNGSLVQGIDGNFYGTTQYGGANNEGTVFKVTPDGTITTLYSFCGQANCADGAGPVAGLLQALDENLYGTANGGGSNPGGTVFKVTPAGAVTTLYNFCAQANCVDGASPFSALIQATDGQLYGTTSAGGVFGGGTVFKITPSGTLSTIYDFCSQADCTDGQAPLAGLIQGVDGNFYGTTYGYQFPNMTVFKITPTGSLTVLYSFCAQYLCPDGSGPRTVIQGSDGTLYGITTWGGNGYGTIFKVTAADVFTTMHVFCHRTICADGAEPLSGLIQATDKFFYGATVNGGGGTNQQCGDFGCGVLYKLTPEGKTTTLHIFCQPSCTDGASPLGLLQATNGSLYGTTQAGGTNHDGTVFRLDLGLGPFVAFVRSSGKVGQTAEILGQGFTGTTSVSFSGTAASFTVKSDTFLTATVPTTATSGYVTVTTPSGTLKSNVPFRVRP